MWLMNGIDNNNRLHGYKELKELTVASSRSKYPRTVIENPEAMNNIPNTTALHAANSV